ncbi:hypothetical protein [Mycolicibacterium smegmatis]|uniref:hypothetical protein n=1 Tax=Mycolicibacterium smegmatis TaxID=1772 RepID=UPI001EFBFE8F|nr:hypothetical protein [Mycolicibacterium smegmatis]ULN35586.1 hypothetical protein KZ781_00355 [Mycolicibacterium smegmatis]
MVGGLALLVVIGVTVVATIAVTKKSDGNGLSLTPIAADERNGTDIASANDSGPVAVITEDPTCAAQGPILATWAEKAKNGWDKRDSSIPAVDWTPEVRTQHHEVGEALREATDQLVPLAKLTPHRVMRELYEQFIAYGRAYVESIPTYTPPDDYLARATVATTEVIGNICAAIDYGSAASRAPLVSPLPAPSELASVRDPNEPTRFLVEPNPLCADWNSALTQFSADTKAWLATDPAVPASQWSVEVKSIHSDVVPVMQRLASQIQVLGKKSGNPIWQDLADLSVQYRTAYVKAIPTYIPADNYLVTVSSRLNGMVDAACQAVGD